jgi:hypothetical protein
MNAALHLVRISHSAFPPKVITSVDAEKFGDWEAAGFAPEGKFLTAVSELEGITTVETQTFTIMPM